MMVGTDVSRTCGGDGNVSPELVLRLQAPVDHRFDNLGHERDKERVRDVRLGVRKQMVQGRGHGEPCTRRKTEMTATEWRSFGELYERPWGVSCNGLGGKRKRRGRGLKRRARGGL